jgi:hypothetical protein
VQSPTDAMRAVSKVEPSTRSDGDPQHHANRSLARTTRVVIVSGARLGTNGVCSVAFAEIIAFTVVLETGHCHAGGRSARPQLGCSTQRLAHACSQGLARPEGELDSFRDGSPCKAT